MRGIRTSGFVGDRGPRSQIASFTWSWPSTTNPTETNIATNAGIVDPQFSWDPIPGAAGKRHKRHKHR